MARKMLKQGTSPVQEAPATAQAAEDDGLELFTHFVAIVDDLLGEHLPEAIVNDFVASENFETYRGIGITRDDGR